MTEMPSAPNAAWEPTGWWRAVLDNGSLWSESTDEAEIREAAKRALRPATVQRHMRRTEERWEDA